MRIITTPADEPPNQRIAAIVGNGLSISAEPTLAIPDLTAEISTRFEAATKAKGSTPVDRVLARLAKRGADSGDPAKDFEAMIGPLDQQRENLEDLRELAAIVGDEVKPVRSALRTVDTFVESLRRQGVGHALNVISERSVATAEHREKIDDFLTSLIDSANGSRVTIGNLNYDSMVMASLCDRYQTRMCDLADGRVGATFDLHGNGVLVHGQRLRDSISAFPNRQIRLLHLHGALTWLKNPVDGRVYRFRIEDLRTDFDYDEDTGRLQFRDTHWERWRDGKSEWEPQVVLTNQSAKSALIANEPFKIGYDALFQSLVESDRWLLAGYSFRDGCVNDLLAKAWDARTSVPEVMVVTYGNDLKKRTVLDAVGFNPVTDPPPASFLHMCRHGIQEAPSHNAWRAWCDAVAMKNAA